MLEFYYLFWLSLDFEHFSKDTIKLMTIWNVWLHKMEV